MSLNHSEHTIKYFIRYSKEVAYRCHLHFDTIIWCYTPEYRIFTSCRKVNKQGLTNQVDRINIHIENMIKEYDLDSSLFYIECLINEKSILRKEVIKKIWE